MKKTLLFLSNGHGEDQITGQLIHECLSLNSTLLISVLPLVGLGLSLKNKKLTWLGPQKEMPSGGFIKNRLALWQDLCAGLLPLHFQQIQTLRHQPSQFNAVIAVGDFFPLILGAWFTKHHQLYFIPTAKSDRFEHHNIIEKWVMKQTTKAVFPRDVETTQALKNQNVPAIYHGNIMVDSVVSEQIVFPNDRPIITVLPGSRTEAYPNFRKILAVIQKLPATYRVIVAHSKTMDISPFQKTDSEQRCEYTTAFVDAVKASQMVIGLAGTANEQVIGLGKVLVTFPGYGPQTTQKRLIEQCELLNHLPVFIDEENPDIIAATIIQLLKDDNLIKKVANNGPFALGNSGGAAKIAQEIMNGIV